MKSGSYAEVEANAFDVLGLSNVDKENAAHTLKKKKKQGYNI